MSNNPSITTTLNHVASIKLGQPLRPQQWVCDEEQLNGTGITVSKTVEPGKAFGASAQAKFEISSSAPVQKTIEFDLVDQTDGSISETFELDFVAA